MPWLTQENSVQPHITCCSLYTEKKSTRTCNHIHELVSKVTLLKNRFLRKFRGLKHISLFCLAEHAMETFTPPFLLKLTESHAEATLKWIFYFYFQGREILSRFMGNFCNLFFLRKSLFFSTTVLSLQRLSASQ